MSYEQTIGQRREQYMRTFKDAVKNNDVEAAKIAFQTDILSKHNGHIGDAILDTYNALSSCETEINTPQDTRIYLAEMKESKPTAYKAIIAVGDSQKIDLRSPKAKIA